jgi:DNA-binding beta-propeller fold protein YncE
MAYNQFSGLLYIANEESDNVSIIRDLKFAGNIPTGNWPNFVASDPLSDAVYVSHVWNGIWVMNGTTITAQIPGYGESYTPMVNPINGYTYVTDLHRPISIIRGREKIADLFVPDFNGKTLVWHLAVDYDASTGLSYFASWEHGAMTVVDGTIVVDQFSYEGEGATDMAIDSQRRLLFVANNRANKDAASPNNISVIDLNTLQVKSIYSSKYSLHLGLDQLTGYVYVTNPEDNTVTVLRGRNEVATYAAGNKPWHVAVDSVRGLAYITHAADNSVTIYRDGVQLSSIALPEDKGFEPYQIVIDEESGRVFILNRSSKEKPTYPDLQVTICREPWVHILE